MIRYYRTVSFRASVDRRYDKCSAETDQEPTDETAENTGTREADAAEPTGVPDGKPAQTTGVDATNGSWKTQEKSSSPHYKMKCKFWPCAFQMAILVDGFIDHNGRGIPHERARGGRVDLRRLCTWGCRVSTAASTVTILVPHLRSRHVLLT